MGQVKSPAGERLSDRVAIGVLTRAFPYQLVDEVIAETGRGEQRSRLLPARVVVYFVLAMCLFFGQERGPLFTVGQNSMELVFEFGMWLKCVKWPRGNGAEQHGATRMDLMRITGNAAGSDPVPGPSMSPVPCASESFAACTTNAMRIVSETS